MSKVMYSVYKITQAFSGDEWELLNEFHDYEKARKLQKRECQNLRQGEDVEILVHTDES